MPDRDNHTHEEWDEIEEPDDDLALDPSEYRVFSADDPEEDLDLETAEAIPAKPALDEVLDSLERGERHFSELIGFSDLDAADINVLAARWPTIDPALRATVVRESLDLSLEAFEYSLSRFYRFASTDDDPQVRQLAAAALGHEADKVSFTRLVELLTEDTSQDVRAEAATSLGPYAAYAVFDELPKESAEQVERLLFEIAEDEDESWHVRRRAAESAAIFGPSERVEQLVRRMYEEDELGLRASALYAIGNGNLMGWLPVVLEHLNDEDAAIRFEAARAAGMLGDVEALPELSELAKDEHDVDVRHAAIAAIGSIGGQGASRILTRLFDMAPEADREPIMDALTETSGEDFDTP
jgi:hypothetical protein